FFGSWEFMVAEMFNRSLYGALVPNLKGNFHKHSQQLRISLLCSLWSVISVQVENLDGSFIALGSPRSSTGGHGDVKGLLLEFEVIVRRGDFTKKGLGRWPVFDRTIITQE